MSIAVVGIANVERAVPVPDWPLAYEPVRYVPGLIQERVGGVGFNVARGLATLGNEVVLNAPLGSDLTAGAIRGEAEAYGFTVRASATAPVTTPKSVVLVAPDGSRMVNTDLGDALRATMDESALLVDGRPAEAAVLGNLDFSRPLLAAARELGIPTVVDLQVVERFDNPYDQDFLTGADVLVLSHEKVPGDPADFLAGLLERSRARFIVMGMGAEGSLAWERGAAAPIRTPAAALAPGTETTGAGDSFVAGLVHFALVEKRPLADALVASSQHTAAFLGKRAEATTPVPPTTSAPRTAASPPTAHRR